MAIGVTIRGTPLHDTANIQAQTMTDAGTPTAGVFLLGVSVNRGNAVAPSAAYTGYGLTWTDIGNFGWNVAVNVSFYGAISTGANSTDPVSTWAASTGRHMTVYEVTGVDTSAAILGGIIRDQGAGVYLVGATANNTTPAVTLASPLNAANRGFMVIEHPVAEDTVPEAGWTELDEGSFLTPTSDCMVAWTPSAFDTSVTTAAITSSVWGIAALEIIAGTPPGAAIHRRLVHSQAIQRASRW